MLRGKPDGAFPHDANTPAFLREGINGLAIAFLVATELLVPELCTRLGQAEKGTAFVAVPKAAVDEDGCPPLGKHEVRFPRQCLRMEAKTKTRAPEQPPNHEFRLRIAASNSRHQSGALVRAHHISHWNRVQNLSARNKGAGTVGVIDIFAGPGGLGEGFSSFEAIPGSGIHPFEIAVSAEMEKSAHATLRLRAFSRMLEREGETASKAYRNFLIGVAKKEAGPPEQVFGSGRWARLWAEAEAEALNLTMGVPEHNALLNERIRQVRDRYSHLVLVGGPPCQAYSLVGRARQKNVKGFQTKGDHRHFLYRQYLGILADFAPDVFIMENVKGILTSKVGGQDMFSAISADLGDPRAALRDGKRSRHASERYVLLPIHIAPNETRDPEKVAKDPGGFVIRCENHGAPQARHRVIIMGVREDCLTSAGLAVPGLRVGRRTPIEAALAGLPKLRSGLSREPDTAGAWKKAAEKARSKVISSLASHQPEVRFSLESIVFSDKLSRSSIHYTSGGGFFSVGLRQEMPVLLNHETRGHMQGDLSRYLYCSSFGAAYGRSPTSGDFPKRLAPEHDNWESGSFADRFRVQVHGKPSSTVTSHLSKDGHAFIHWDPAQLRSLTVREAARLQTFPDDYLFLGNRTQQFVQVGNAVPPMIARQIAGVVFDILNPPRSANGPGGA